MNRHQIRPIKKEDIPAMASLLLARQAIEMAVFPHLDNESVQEDLIIKELEELFADNQIVGHGAFHGQELVGYLFATLNFDAMRGRHAWVPYEGMAIGAEESLELVRALYAKASALWVQQGYFTHYSFVPLGREDYLKAFHHLSFAMQQVIGVLKVEDYLPFAIEQACTIRKAKKEDATVMGKMSSIIFSHQSKSPVFELSLPEIIGRIKKGYEGLASEEEAEVLLAEEKGEVLGFQVYVPSEADLLMPANGAELSVAGTSGQTRNKGIGKSLMNEGARLAIEKGYDYIMADWRVTNLTSSTFWPKCGFKPVAYRMVRHIDERVSWANFESLGIESLD